MYPAVALKRIFTPVFWRKNQVIKFVLVDELGICYPVVIISITIITGGTDKLFTKNRNKIIIHVYVLIHAAKKFNVTLVLYSAGINSLDHFSSFQWFFLIIVVYYVFIKDFR